MQIHIWGDIVFLKKNITQSEHSSTAPVEMFFVAFELLYDLKTIV